IGHQELRTEADLRLDEEHPPARTALALLERPGQLGSEGACRRAVTRGWPRMRHYLAVDDLGNEMRRNGLEIGIRSGHGVLHPRRGAVAPNAKASSFGRNLSSSERSETTK